MELTFDGEYVHVSGRGDDDLQFTLREIVDVQGAVLDVQDGDDTVREPTALLPNFLLSKLLVSPAEKSSIDGCSSCGRSVEETEEEEFIGLLVIQMKMENTEEDEDDEFMEISARPAVHDASPIFCASCTTAFIDEVDEVLANHADEALGRSL